MRSLRDREVACSASDLHGLNFESCVWRTASSHLSHHPQRFSWPNLACIIYCAQKWPKARLISFHVHFSFTQRSSPLGLLTRRWDVIYRQQRQLMYHLDFHIIATLFSTLIWLCRHAEYSKPGRRTFEFQLSQCGCSLYVCNATNGSNASGNTIKGPWGGGGTERFFEK